MFIRIDVVNIKVQTVVSCCFVLRPRLTAMVMSGWSVIPTTLFLGKLRPPKQLTSTSCTYFCQELTTTLIESAEGETKVCGHTRY